MSKVVDERVVEMRFDNKQFESNVSQSMSTLQKLKQSLNLKGASKGLDDVNKAAKRVDMNPISRGVETITAKFSALQVMGITALTNITNQAVNAGKRMVSALTIDPIKSGFKEYETQINAIQTILANTQKEGADITRVNAALDELNAYADKTIYNFTEMTRNIGTFTAAGVDLDTSVNAIQGIANLAAISGSTSQQASTAMYQLSQALSSGTVKLMDWNSVVNAGMGGQVFQDALKETARVHGIAIDQLIEDEGSFRETLSKGWLSSEILTETLQKFTLTTEGLTKEQIQANREMLKAKGYTEDQIDEIFKLGETATNAATKVKTFTQLWDVLKEAAQSGWAQTWRLIVGDFEEAKALFTPLSEFFTGIINKMSDARNKVLESALGKSFLLIGEKMQMLVRPANEAKKAIDDISGTVSNAIDTVTNLDEVVSKVIKGDFGNGQKRYDALTKAGYKWWEVQNKVNETLGSTKRHLADQTEAQEELNDAQEKTIETTGEVTSENEKLTEQQKERLKILAKMSDEELRSLGYTEWQIESFKKLRDTADELGLSIEELIDNADNLNGRWLIMDSFKNIGKSLLKIFTAIGEAWKKVFDPVDPENIFKGIGAFHKFTSQLVISDDTAEKITSTFQGLFSILHLISTIAGGGLKLAFTIITKLLGSMGLGILDVTAFIGDAITKVHDFIFNNKLLNAAFDLLGRGILSAVDALKKLWNSFVNLPIVKDFISIIKGLPDTVSASFSEIVSAFDGGFVNGVTTIIEKFTEFAIRIKDAIIDKFSEFDFSELGKNIIEGLKNGLSDGGIISSVIEGIKTIGQSLIDAFCELLGIHSPSTVFFNFGAHIMEGLSNGIVSFIDIVIESIGTIGSKIIETFKNVISGIDFSNIFTKFSDIKIGDSVDLSGVSEKLKGFWDTIKGFDFSKILNLVPIGTVLYLVKKMSTISEAVINLSNSISGVLDGVQNVLNSFARIEQELANTIKAYRKDIQSKTLMRIVISIAILAAALIALSFIDTKKLWQSMLVLGTLAAIIVGLAFAMDKLNSASVSFKKGEGFNIEGLKNGLMAIGICILLLAASLKLIGSMKPEELMQGFVGLGAIILALASVFVIFGATAKIAGENASAINSAGKTFLQIAAALLILTFVVKRIAKMEWGDMGKAAVFLLGFVVFIKLLTKATTIGNDKQIAKIGGLLISISFALLLMVGVCKLIGLLTPADMIKGAIFVGAYLFFIKALTKAATLGKKSEHIAKISGLLIAISFSLLLMVGVCKLVGLLTPEEMLKGAAFVLTFIVFIGILMTILKIGKKDKVAQVAGTILAFSLAVGMLALVSILMGMVSLQGLMKGITAVVLLGLVMAAMIAATKGANDCYKSIIVLVVAIAIMVAAVAVLASMDPKALGRSTAALVAMMLSFAAMEKCLPQKTAKKLLSSLIVLTVIVAILAGILVGMSLLGVNNAIKNTLALTTLMLAFAATMKIMGTCKSISKAALKGIYAMASIIVILAGILVGMSMLNVETSYSNIIGLSVLMLAFAATMKIMGTCKSISKAAIKGIYAMAGIVVILAGILVGLSLLNVETSLNNIAGLSTLMLAFAASMVIMGYAKAISKDAIPGMFAMIAVTALLALVLWELDALNVEASIETTASLALLLIAFATATLILSKIGVGATAAVTGALAMAAVIGVVGIVIAAIGALVDKFPQLETFLDKGIPILEKIGYGIGSFIGNFIAGIAGGVLNILPKLGMALSSFMANAMVFIAGCKLVDEKVLEGISILSLAILELCAAKLIDSITSFLSVGNSFGKLGAKLSDFIINAMPFIIGIKLLDSKSLESANMLVNLVKTLSEAKITEFASKILSGGVSFADFGAQLGEFAEAIVNVSNILKKGNLDTEAISSLSEIGTTFATLQDSIAPMGGFVKAMKGSKDLGDFGVQIQTYASCLKAASDSLTNENGTLSISPFAINVGVTAGEAMATLQSTIEPIGGFSRVMKEGSKDLGAFGVQIAIYASCLKSASDSLTTETGTLAISPDAIQAGVDAGTAMATLQSTIEPIGGFARVMKEGSKDLGTFGVQIQTYASCLKAASDSLTTEKGTLAISQDAIQAGADAGAAMTTLQSAIEPMGFFVKAMKGAKDLGDFGEQIQIYAESLKTASNALSGEDGSIAINQEAIEAAVAAGNALVALQKTIPESTWLDGKVELDQFGKDVKKYGNGIASLGESVANVDGDKVLDSINWGKRLVSLSNALDEFNQNGLEKFKKVKDIGTAIKDYYGQIQSIDITILSSSISSANKLKNLIKGLVDIDASGVEKFKVTSIGTAIKEYYDKVSGIDANLVASSISSANALKNLIAGLVGIDTTGVELFNPAIIGTRIKAYADNVLDIDLSGVDSSLTAARSIKEFISSLVGFDSSGVSLFSAAINELSSIKIGEFVAAFGAAAEQMPDVGLNFMNGMTQGIEASTSTLLSTTTTVINEVISSMRNRASVFGSTGTLLINKVILGIKNKSSSFTSTGSTLMSKLISGIKSKASSISSAATSTLSSAVNAIRSYYNSFNNAGKFLGDGLIVGMNLKQAEAYNAGFALGKKSAEGVKAGAAVNSPSKLTIKTGEGLGEGLVVGMTNSMASVLKSSKDMGKRAAMSVASALNTVSNNADMSYEPTVRPVVDLSSFQYQADNLNIGAEISSRFLSGPVNSLQNIVTRAQTEINSSNAQVITAINDLRDDLNAYYSNDDNEISLYIDSRKVASTIAKPMNRELNILARRGAY